jgi:GAF domain-containing protein
MAVPVKLRDQIVGVINARKASEDRGWGAEERILLMQLGEQIGLALENARLYQETRRRAAQEQLVGEVTTRMRASLNLEDILETTVQELGQRLDLDEVVLQLVEDESPVTGG